MGDLNKLTFTGSPDVQKNGRGEDESIPRRRYNDSWLYNGPRALLLCVICCHLTPEPGGKKNKSRRSRGMRRIRLFWSEPGRGHFTSPGKYRNETVTLGARDAPGTRISIRHVQDAYKAPASATWYDSPHDLRSFLGISIGIVLFKPINAMLQLKLSLTLNLK